MKKLFVAILFAMVLTGTGLAISASNAKAGNPGFSYYYVDSFGFGWSSGPYYIHKPGYWNGYNRGYNQGYRNGYYNSCKPLPYSYKPYPYWNKPYYYYNFYYGSRPYYYTPRPPRPYYRYPRWRCWP